MGGVNADGDNFMPHHKVQIIDTGLFSLEAHKSVCSVRQHLMADSLKQNLSRSGIRAFDKALLEYPVRVNPSP